MDPTLLMLAVAAVEHLCGVPVGSTGSSRLRAAPGAARPRGPSAILRDLLPEGVRPDVGAHDPILVLQGGRLRPCPHCAGRRILRWGRFGPRRLRQRYRCRDCGRTFNDHTGTALDRMRRKELWPAFCRCMLEGMTVRRAADHLGVHRDTSFRWRHRLLGAVRAGERYRLGRLVSVEESQVYWRWRVLLALDERGRAAGEVVPGSYAGVDDVASLLETRLLDDGPTTLLSPDGPAGAVARYARQAGVGWARRGPVDPRFDARIERVRWYAFRFRRWLARFRGVAGHYLSNYLAWFRLVDGPLWRGFLQGASRGGSSRWVPDSA